MFTEPRQYKRYWVIFGILGCGFVFVIATSIVIMLVWLAAPSSDLLQSWKVNDVIYDFSLSPNGQLVALSTDSDRCWTDLMECSPSNIQVRRVDTGALVYTWEGTDAQFSPDGRYLAINGSQGIDFWYLTDGTLEYTVGVENYDKFALNPDGTMLAAVLPQTHQIDLWDLHIQKLIRQVMVDDDQINAITFSPDSQNLAWSGGRTVEILQISNENISHQLVGYTGGLEGSSFYSGGELVDGEVINDIDFSPDGKLLAAGTGVTLQGDCYSMRTADHTVRIWRVADGQTLHIFTEPQFGVEAVAFSPDGSLLAGVGGTHERYLGNTNSDWLWCSGKQDAVVRLWNVDNGQLVIEMKGHKTLVTDVEFSPDGSWLITSGTDGTVKHWAISNKD